MKKKSIGAVSLSALLSLSLLAPSVGATSLYEPNHEEKVKIQVASVNVVSKTELIKRVKVLFPGKFDFLSNNDYHLHSGHRFPEDNEDIIRYSLSFSKEVGGKYIHGNFEFVGEELELNGFYYRPANEADALFPAKVSKDDAQKIADEFLKKLTKSSSNYKLTTNHYHYYRPNQTLTEPIRYDFSYEKFKDGVPISSQNVHITILGNGELIQFNGPYYQTHNFTYEDVKNAKSKETILKQIKDNFTVDLQYFIDFDYRTQEANVQLAYIPLQTVTGVHATSGKWMVHNSFIETLPAKKELKMLVDQPLKSKYTSFSLNDAKALAEKLLNVDDIEGVKLNIDAIDERTNHLGKEVISVNYMYHTGNSGTGTNFEVDKNTGAILQYHDLKEQLLRDLGKSKKPVKELSYDEALKLAVDYAKEYAPSYLHLFAYPTIEASSNQNGFTISFPRIHDGLVVANEGLNVGISHDGALNSFNVNLFEIDKWPSKEKIISEDTALKEYLKHLDIELRYLNNYWDTKSKEYNLVYTTKYHEDYQLIDALTGKWTSNYRNQEEAEKPVVTNHWAAEELNFMINAGIIKVKDVETFNPNASTTKGEALEVIMKSLTRFYDYYYDRGEQSSHTFENIQPDHELYQIVERAVNLGVLDNEKKQFAYDEPLTRQELAVWYVRALGLEEAAKHGNIYKVNFADAGKVSDENKGYVALANALGVLTTSNNRFNPEQEVTLGQLAVSNFRLARLVYNDNRLNRY
ncbi:S-layer homology domain-containing protein [Anaerobacillus alkaliphilus]|uniref:S-layer homology domain-containing protein n=1 Tax=Anaerobacillus alkaliphilus TaxID=1548597 RepID=UPI0019D68A3A|nr:S-layer homology domain-containing protein [Anaerobacillus alkaliphilus]